MNTGSIRKVARETIVVALLSLMSMSMSACTIAPNHSLASETSHQSQVAANDYANRCGEQTALLKHEIALCRSVPLITVPLQ
jgi:hypothetical protein